MDVLALVEALNAIDLGAVLVTAVHREGALQGTDMALMAEVAKLSKAPVLASGGVTTLEDLDSLAQVGVAGAIIGMALYTGRLDPRALSKYFASG
jgi:phosphoribosylformimino-5-aminoimidazole carboxamide ribotide isomerase